MQDVRVFNTLKLVDTTSAYLLIESKPVDSDCVGRLMSAARLTLGSCCLLT